jgi:cbb3-type cytochrome oxidase maturation protein
MDSLFLLIPLSVLLVFIIGFLFWWSVRSGQYDDMEGPAYRMLMDDDDPKARNAQEQRPGGQRSNSSDSPSD